MKSQTLLTPKAVERVEYVERQALLGIIKWHEEVSRTEITNHLHITTDIEPKKVFLNGRLIK